MSVQILLKTLLFISLLILTSLSAIAKSIDNTLTIEYTLAGKTTIIIGEKTKQGYRFNKSSTKVVHLATTSWPPYISEGNCNKGWVFKLAAALLVSKGYQVNINFYPWARSKMLAEQGLVDIVFPQYDNRKTNNAETVTTNNPLVLSDPFPGGTLSLITHKDSAALKADDLTILYNKVVGVVRGNNYTVEINNMVNTHIFSVVEAVDELQLVRMMVAKRVDFILGDRKVFNHSVTISKLSDTEKRDLLQQLKLLEPSLAEHPLFFALSTKRPHWQSLQTDLNDALQRFKVSGETQRFIDKNATFRCYQPEIEYTPL
ncbi:transporter substrate-binding domain-containing protein [Colwellia sp. D2M02]|uniref:substrate-binding periplasmic protein n=1 Tax=Colwellia sp. D2M02 TaxID=2841562 RepID=UPI001C08C177|nr:transporter substrate-binding domain-containing protein [Colwellia sp. D2M02]MBU2894662.1 transporter substrate-binding domain-containing protein [Colwellia sp. D2M02]